MWGWWISIEPLNPEKMDHTILAHWEAGGGGGIDWLDKLVSQGQAQQLEKGGYPNRWQAQAGVILPLLKDLPVLEKGRIYAVENSDSLILGMAEYEKNCGPVRWLSKITQYPDRIAACDDEQLLTIEAWDLS